MFVISGMFVPAIMNAWMALAAAAAERPPHIGYAYPAGGQTGTTFEVQIGGENIYGATAVIFSGSGVSARVTAAGAPDTDQDGAKQKQKRKNQTVIDEVITAQVAVAWNAEPGERTLCLVTPRGLSDKLFFHVGQFPETREIEPNDRKGTATPLPPLPVTVNGQIMSGDADLFGFAARKGQHLVVETTARTLAPYLADAVPGWFQAVVALYDAQGREVAYADDYRFSPDPVLFYDVPADGEYRLMIRDSICRGRADFVYRIKIGEQPFITAVYPLGTARSDKPVTVKLSGRNLPADSLAVCATQAAPGVVRLSAQKDGLISSSVPFAVGTLPETVADEALIRKGQGQMVALPIVVNGRLGAPGAKAVFCFAGKQGQTVCLSVQARRLGSPLDSHLALEDDRGAKLAENDDVKDKGAGLITHQADSEIVQRLPADGIYRVTLRDTQGKGGEEYAYRLTLAAPAPDFDLRITPATVNLPRGGSAVVTAHALRRNGFADEIRLAFAAPVAGCALDGAQIPAGTDKVRLTLSTSEAATPGLVFPVIQGTAVMEGDTVSHPAAAAEERMQAFAYQHLVPVGEMTALIETSVAPFTVTAQLPPQGFLDLPLGKETAFRVRAARHPGFDGPIRLELVDPPKGIALRGANIGPGKDNGWATVRVESKIEGRPKENLIFTGTMMLDWRTWTGGNAGRPASNAAPAGAANPAATQTVNAVVTGGNPGASTNAGARVKGGKGPQRNRIIVMLPAVPFRVSDNPDSKKAETPQANQPAAPGGKKPDAPR